MTDTVTTAVELPDSMRDPMREQVNHGLMVAFINARLLERANLDVRKSIVLYDDAGLVEYALPELPDAETLERLYRVSGIRYWSKGIAP
jgi:hypothetical protein